MRVSDQTLNYILKQSNEHSRACILNSIISKDAENPTKILAATLDGGLSDIYGHETLWK